MSNQCNTERKEKNACYKKGIKDSKENRTNKEVAERWRRIKKNSLKKQNGVGVMEKI